MRATLPEELKPLFGKIIAIEGADAVGKTKQTDLLVSALERHMSVYRFDFPQYGENVYANLLNELLHGSKEKGDIDFLALDPRIACCPYALDRVAVKDEITEGRKRGVVVCNRYTPSNIAHQCAKLPETKWAEFIDFIERGEYEELKIPRPDLTLYLAVPAHVAQQLLEGKKDQHERNVPYQERVRKVYLKLAHERPDWIFIDCFDEKGTLLSPAEMHKMVIAQITASFF